MDDTLRKMIDALPDYDEYFIEEIYSQLKLENYQYRNDVDLLTKIIERLSEESNKYRDNKLDYEQYEMREKMLARYKKAEAYEVYRFIFSEDSLQICDEVDSNNGIGNVIRMDIVEYWITNEKGRKQCLQKGIQTVITEDLRFLLVSPKKVEKRNIILSNVNLNTYFGNRRLRENIDKVFGLIIDIDGVVKKTQVMNLLDKIDREEIPVPNFLINSGHGIHLYYIFEEPIEFHKKSYAIYPVLKNILNAIKDLIWTPSVSDLKPEMMDLNRAYTIIGTKNRKNPDLIVTAYKINPIKCSLPYIRSFIDKPDDDSDFDISFPSRSKVTKEEAKILYPHWAVQKFPELFEEEERRKLLEEIEQKKMMPKKKKYEDGRAMSVCNVKVYNWFLKLISDPNNLRQGNRYKCMVGLAIYGVKCGIAKEQVQKDLESLLPVFNSVKIKNKDVKFIMDETDIHNALRVYKNKKMHLCTFEWIMQFTEIEYKKKTKRREQPLSQEEHLKIARKNCDELHPNGSWRAYSDGAIRENVLNYIRENPMSDIKDCIEKGICSRATAYKYWEECRNELGLEKRKRISNEEKVRNYRLSYPDATKADCIRDLGLSKPTVYKYWE